MMYRNWLANVSLERDNENRCVHVKKLCAVKFYEKNVKSEISKSSSWH